MKSCRLFLAALVLVCGQAVFAFSPSYTMTVRYSSSSGAVWATVAISANDRATTAAACAALPYPGHSDWVGGTDASNYYCDWRLGGVVQAQDYISVSASSCPSNSTGTTSCSCNTGYVQAGTSPDSCILNSSACAAHVGTVAYYGVAEGWVKILSNGHLAAVTMPSTVCETFNLGGGATCIGTFVPDASLDGVSYEAYQKGAGVNGYADTYVYGNATSTATGCSSVTPSTNAAPAPACEGGSITLNGQTTCSSFANDLSGLASKTATDCAVAASAVSAASGGDVAAQAAAGAAAAKTGNAIILAGGTVAAASAGCAAAGGNSASGVVASDQAGCVAASYKSAYDAAISAGLGTSIAGAAGSAAQSAAAASFAAGGACGNATAAGVAAGGVIAGGGSAGAAAGAGAGAGAGISSNRPFPGTPHLLESAVLVPQPHASGGTGLYSPKYTHGLSGVWDDKKASLLGTPVLALAHTMMPTITSSGYPSWTIHVVFGGRDFGTYVLELSSLVWQFLRVCVIVTALFTARALIFGG